MSGLPTIIPPQSAPLAQVNGSPVNIDINWYLWLYNLSKQIFGTGGGSGSVPTSPYDSLESANLFVQTADIPQAYRCLENLAARLSIHALPDGADIVRVQHDLTNAFLLAAGALLPDAEPAAQPAKAVTVGASPFTYMALANGVLSVTGGAMSNVSIIRQGVTVATGITSSSSSGIGKLTDEKGLGGQPGFVAGVDFTAGTSTTLTLSGTYASAEDLGVAFDGAEQGANTYTLSGTTLTFDAPIPLGTTNVFVKGASTATFISSDGGLVPLRRLDQVQITYTSAPTAVFLPD